jgi:hypothetical protein
VRLHALAKTSPRGGIVLATACSGTDGICSNGTDDAAFLEVEDISDGGEPFDARLGLVTKSSLAYLRSGASRVAMSG